MPLHQPVVFLTMIISLAIATAGEAGSLPDDLVAVARQHKCSPISDDEASLEPKRYYAYGYAEAGKETDSAVFWCEGETDGMPRLVFTFRDPALDTDGCPNVIAWPDTPGRLGIMKDVDVTLDEYAHVDDKTKPGPKGIRPSRNGVISIFDGAPHFEITITEYFYCHGGAWLKRRELQH